MRKGYIPFGQSSGRTKWSVFGVPVARLRLEILAVVSLLAATAVAASLGYAYPGGDDQRVSEFLLRIRRMPREGA